MMFALFPFLVLIACSTPVVSTDSGITAQKKTETHLIGPAHDEPFPFEEPDTRADIPAIEYTSPGPGQTFLVFGDTGTGDDNQILVAQLATRWCQQADCQFIVGVGDNFYSVGVSGLDDEQFQTKFEDVYSGLDLPFYMVLGNHDVIGDVDAQVAYTKKSTRWNMPGRWYSQTVGDIALFGIDTNDPSEEQRLEIIEAIETSQARWKVVFGHYPLRTIGSHPDATGEFEAFLKSIICHRVDFYLSGHDHNLQRLKEECGVELLVSGAGGASLYSITEEEGGHFGLSEYGFIEMTANTGSMTSRFINSSGRVIYSFKKKKTKIVRDCIEDAFCDQGCDLDPDCASVDCSSDGACTLSCSDDPDCILACTCDQTPGTCDSIEINSTTKCGCDPSCVGAASACDPDDICDDKCPIGLDPDCL